MSDVATALTQSIAVDGQTPATANLPMATFKHTNVAVASATTDYLRADQGQNSALEYLTSVSGTNTITASASITPAAYAAGQTFRFVSAGANTGAVTLNVNGLGAKNVTKNGTTALVAGDIPASAVVEVIYDGTQFQLTTFVSTAFGPAFFASPSVTQSVTTATYTKVNLGTEAFDTNNCFSASRFTPTTAGYYQFSAGLYPISSSGASYIWALIYKNGTLAIAGNSNAAISATDGVSVASGLLQMNGTTDYVEMYCYIVGTSPVIQTTQTFLSGFLARAA
jgi:hypothetical protein